MNVRVIGVTITLLAIYIGYVYWANNHNFRIATQLIGECKVRMVLTGAGKNTVTLKNGESISITTILPFTDFSFPVSNTPDISGDGIVIGRGCEPIYAIQ